eukprot:1162151-Pelagomonas_calceolata.AAC.11
MECRDSSNKKSIARGKLDAPSCNLATRSPAGISNGVQGLQQQKQHCKGEARCFILHFCQPQHCWDQLWSAGPAATKTALQRGKLDAPSCILATYSTARIGHGVRNLQQQKQHCKGKARCSLLHSRHPQHCRDRSWSAGPAATKTALLRSRWINGS